jgi:hypothetical protein
MVANFVSFYLIDFKCCFEFWLNRMTKNGAIISLVIDVGAIEAAVFVTIKVHMCEHFACWVHSV